MSILKSFIRSKGTSLVGELSTPFNKTISMNGLKPSISIDLNTVFFKIKQMKMATVSIETLKSNNTSIAISQKPYEKEFEH